MTQLPDYLRNRKSSTIGDRATVGLGSPLPPHISIRGNGFTLIDSAGNKRQVETRHLDVVIIDISDGNTKMYYAEKWTPDSNEPPLCFSMNGVAPSREAQQAQARTCQECQHNVRGSAVSQISGKPIKACRDQKELAVLVPAAPGMLFRLTLTPGSFKNWVAYDKKFAGQPIDKSDVVTRLSFEPDVTGVLAFEATSYIDQATYDAREQALLGGATDVLVGRGEAPAALPNPVAAASAVLPPPAQNLPNPFTTQGSTSLAAAQTGPMGATAQAAQTNGEGTRRRRTAKADAPAPQQEVAPVAPFRPAEGPAFGIGASAPAPDPGIQGVINGLFGK